MEDVKSKGLDDVVLDAFVLQDLSARHQAQDDHGNTMDAFPADLAVREAGISRVWGKYGIPKFVPLSIDDPIILNQPTKDLDQKKALCYQRLHSRYLHEHGRRKRLAEVFGYEISVDLENWPFDTRLTIVSEQVPPCEACTSRGSESTCEFVKTPKGDPETTTTHTPQHQSDGAAEPRWNAVAESEPIQQPESTLNVGTDNRPLPYTLTAVDARRVRRNESLGCSELRSATNSATSLPDLSETSSLEASDSDGSSHASSETGCSSYDELLHVLPSRQMIDSLIVKYFSSISTLFCVVNAAQFETEYEAFCCNTQVVTASWLSLLFAILALGCRAEEDSKILYLSDDVSIFYEKVAWHCLLTSDSPSEPSLSALKAIVLIIYARTHRGQDVFSDLQLAYRMAVSTKGHIDNGQHVVEPTDCEEYRCLLTGMKTLSLLNAQVHDYYRSQDLIQDLLPPADIYQSTERANLPLSAEESPPQMTFTILNLQLLEISHTISASTEIGMQSEWSLKCIEAELFRMEKHCSEVYANLSQSDSQLGAHQGSHDILDCYINYLLHFVFLTDLNRYLDGEITPETRISRSKCITFAKASLRNFNLLAENMQLKSYAWYIRGVGSYYAERSALTLTRCLAGFEEEDQDEEARRILNHTLGIFSALSDRSIFSARGAFILDNQCMPIPFNNYSSRLDL
ncbi:hypothetical protein DTO002I6_8183 [Penicillium roqueforti]|nr:hypothetical protein DTO002I6_8183 [Penicillium roqueforti]